MKKKTALITGASQGIGWAVAEELAKNNWKVILVARNEEKLKEFIEKHGDDHSYFIADLTKEASILNLVDFVNKSCDSIDLLLNSAGEGIYKNFEDISFEEWEMSYKLNVFSIFLLTQKILPLLKNSNEAVVINMGSICGVNPIKNRTLYCSTKFALRGMALSLADEYKEHKPDFCLITLGSTLTNFGSMTIEEKKLAQKNGKAYLKIADVVQRLVSIINSKTRRSEYTILP